MFVWKQGCRYFPFTPFANNRLKGVMFSYSVFILHNCYYKQALQTVLMSPCLMSDGAKALICKCYPPRRHLLI